MRTVGVSVATAVRIGLRTLSCASWAREDVRERVRAVVSSSRPVGGVEGVEGVEGVDGECGGVESRIGARLWPGTVAQPSEESRRSRERCFRRVIVVSAGKWRWFEC